MIRWPYNVVSYTQDEVKRHCVNDEYWQRFRLTLKGLPTGQKLKELAHWLFDECKQSRRGYVQVSNYINALKRGGQLDMDCNVQR